MNKILIIGYGNPLRMDDGLGQIAARRIEGMLQGDDVKVMARHQMGIELAADLKDADLAIFIDAHVGDDPGTIKEEEVVPGDAMPASLSHHLAPGVLLGCVHALYQRHPQAFVYSIAAQSFDYGEGLTPAVDAALPVLIDRILARIAAIKQRVS
ncbi:MAG TPA: hydrogenase maturation protease [Dissulfurispiraceae bacterium]|nr:hydrogenase maturation protease [Dissulfurispiraceae bacterium]